MEIFLVVASIAFVMFVCGRKPGFGCGTQFFLKKNIVKHLHNGEKFNFYSKYIPCNENNL